MQSIRSEEELARELASRGVSVFDDESGGFPPPDLYFHCGFLLLLAVGLLSSHVAIFSDFYEVQCSRFTGDYAETEATIVSQSSRIEESHHRSKKGGRVTREETCYSVKAVSDDGTPFSFGGTKNYGSKGDRLTIKYSKNKSGKREKTYVATDFWHMPAERYFGMIFLFLTGLALWGAYAVFRKIRKYQIVFERGLYLPVQRTSRYETEKARGKNGYRKWYAPVYRYAMPDGADLLFLGSWSRDIPEGESANANKVFKVYMMDPEDPENNKYFIK